YTVIIYGLLGIIHFNFFDFILLRIIPTAVINLLLLLILFVPARKLIKKLDSSIDRQA
ncbi:rod shape-determining protein MreD, partial [Staphylococcus condimenti]